MTVVRAVGRQSVTGAVIAPIDASGHALEGHARTFACDLIAVSGGATPPTSLLLQGGAKARYDEATGRFVADGLHDIVHAAGSVAGHDDADSAELSGRIAGAEAALALHGDDGKSHAEVEQDRAALRDRPAPSSYATPPAVARERGTAARRSSTSTRTSRRRTSRSPPPRATTRSSSPSATRR